MKSQLFGKNPIPTSTFYEHLKLVDDLNESEISQLVAAVSRFSLAKTTKEEATALEEARQTVANPGDGFSDLVKLIAFFLAEIESADEEEDVIEDLRSIVKDDTFPWAKIGLLVHSVCDVAKNTKVTELIEDASRSAIPFLKSVSYGVQMRGITQSRFRAGDDISGYKPAFIGVVPIATLSLRLSSGEPVNMQFDVRSLGLLIEHLTVLRTDLECLQQVYPELSMKGV